jgi:Tfp pilus assembly protein PilF
MESQRKSSREEADRAVRAAMEHDRFGRFQEARMEFERAIELDGSNAQIHGTYGIMLGFLATLEIFFTAWGDIRRASQR